MNMPESVELIVDMLCLFVNRTRNVGGVYPVNVVTNVDTHPEVLSIDSGPRLALDRVSVEAGVEKTNVFHSSETVHDLSHCLPHHEHF